MTIADTDVLIDYLADRGEASQVATELASGRLRTTVVSRFELLSGAQNPRQLSSILGVLEAVPALILDDESVDRAAEVRRSLEKMGQGIGMADSLIAGITLANGARLLTRNRRHFSRVPGIEFA